MNAPTREDLLGFVLGALDAPEHQQVADYFNSHPQLQLDLQRIKARLAPLQCARELPTEFAVGLARRTCELISRESRQTAGAQHETAALRDPTEDVPAGDNLRHQETTKRRRILSSVALVSSAAIIGALLGPGTLLFFQPSANSLANSNAVDPAGQPTPVPTVNVSLASRPPRDVQEVFELSPTLISYCGQSFGAMSRSHGMPSSPFANRWTDERPMLRGDWADGERSDDIFSVRRLGRSPLSSPFFQVESNLGRELIAN